MEYAATGPSHFRAILGGAKVSPLEKGDIMKLRAGVLVIAVWLVAEAADAGEFRRIESLRSTGDGGQLVLKDWDGDGDLELLRGDWVDEHVAGRAGRYITLTQIYQISKGAWAARYGFMHHFQQLYGAESKRVERDKVKYSITGDFNDDGVEDMLVAEPGSPKTNEFEGVEFVLRLKQAGKVIFEDPLDGVYAGPDDNFNRFELLDIDGDGTKEVLVWILSYRENDRLIVYGNDKSKWRGNPEYDVPSDLNDALLFLKGLRAARPEPPCPVEVEMEPLKDSECPAFAFPKLPDAKRFRLTFKVRGDGKDVDIHAWRDYFQKWGIAYTCEARLESPVRSAWGLYMEPEGDDLLAAIGVRREGKNQPTGQYYIWVECAFVGAESKPFKWIGTLRPEHSYANFEKTAAP